MLVFVLGYAFLLTHACRHISSATSLMDSLLFQEGTTFGGTPFGLELTLELPPLNMEPDDRGVLVLDSSAFIFKGPANVRFHANR